MINFSTLNSLVIPQGEVVKITSNNIVLWEKAASIKNWVKYSIDTNGNIFNGTGYMNRYRIRSSGELGEYDYASATGYIPVKAGDIIYLTETLDPTFDFTFSDNGNCIHYAGDGFASLGSFTGKKSYYGICNASNSIVTKNGTIFSVTVPNNDSIKYVRISMMGKNIDGRHGAYMIVTVNEEIS